jgi:hypothetical protein
MDSHRRRSVLVRMSEDGQKLATARITNSTARLAAEIRRYYWVAGSALDDWCRIAGSAQRGGIRQPGRPGRFDHP